MKSTSETGHDKNVANLEDLISRCTGYGTAYNPSKASLKIAALQTLLTTGRNLLQADKVSETAHDNATNAREIVFKPLKTLCTRIINSLDSTDAAKQTVDDARTINRKIQGVRTHALDAFISSTTKSADNTAGGTNSVNTTTESNASAPDIVNEISKHRISTSQQGFDSLMDHFAKLIQTVTAEPLYVPNENELKVTSLNTLLTTLKTTNTAVINAETTYNNALLSRNIALYQRPTGLVDIALEVKKYVKSVFGAKSPQYKQISGLQFRRYKF
ncbi:MAG: hypothetical protein ACYC56_12765 [Candidatus Aquicultor sp.]